MLNCLLSLVYVEPLGELLASRAVLSSLAYEEVGGLTKPIYFEK